MAALNKTGNVRFCSHKSPNDRTLLHAPTRSATAAAAAMGRKKIDFLHEFSGRSSPARDDGGAPLPGPHASAAPEPAPAPGATPAMPSPAEDERTRGCPDRQRRSEGMRRELERRIGSPGPHASGTMAPAPGVTPAMASPADDERTRGTPYRQRRFEGLRSELDRRFGSPVDERRRVTSAAAKAATDSRIRVFDFPGPKDEQVEREANRYCLKLPPGEEKNHGKAAEVDLGLDLKHVYDFHSPKDEKLECDAKKYSLKQSPVQEKNDSKLTLNKSKRQGHGGERNPISVDKMHSSQPRSKALCDRNECLKSGSIFCRSSKRRKKQLQNSSSTYSQKVHDVIILDDEDTQPKEEVNFEMSNTQKEAKIYCPSRDNQEAADVTREDIKCLDPGECLSSPVINFYIEYIKTRLSDENFSDKFYIFNTYFYGKLEEVLYRPGDFAKLRRWWKGVNILNIPYIILPIHQSEHWSLIIICMPPQDSIAEPLIIHLDSLAGLHPSAKIMNTVGSYLEKEWHYVSIEETRWTCLLGNIHKKIVQENAYDCGIFMLYYIHQFIKDAPQRTTIDKLGMFNRSWFKPQEASGLRNAIRKLVLETIESARLNDSAMPEADAFEANTNKGIKAEVSKEANVEPNKDISEVAALQEAPTSNNKCNEKTIYISRSLSEADVAILRKAPASSNKRNKKPTGQLLEAVLTKLKKASTSSNQRNEKTTCRVLPDVPHDSCDTTVEIIRTYKKYGPCRWKEGMEPGIRYWEYQTENKRLEGAKLQGSEIRKYFTPNQNG